MFYRNLIVSKLKKGIICGTKSPLIFLKAKMCKCLLHKELEREKSLISLFQMNHESLPGRGSWKQWKMSSFGVFMNHLMKKKKKKKSILRIDMI